MAAADAMPEASTRDVPVVRERRIRENCLEDAVVDGGGSRGRRSKVRSIWIVHMHVGEVGWINCCAA